MNVVRSTHNISMALFETYKASVAAEWVFFITLRKKLVRKETAPEPAKHDVIAKAHDPH